MRRSLVGKSKSAEAQEFRRYAFENLQLMKRQLIDRTYHIAPYRELIVTEPKRRLIMVGSFRDKVLQHCLCDYVLLPKLKDKFIPESYAGQTGKGTLFGLNRLSENLSGFYVEHGLNGYILKCDISKFFYSIDHEKMKRVIAQHFDDEGVRWICNLLIDSTDGPGLPLGNQASQVFALMFLMRLDEMITSEMGFKRYGRYMDDFYVISEDREALKVLLNEIKALLADLGLSLNNKTEIVPLRKGIKFLGFHFYVTDDGTVIRLVNGAKKRSLKKKVRKLAIKVRNGEMSRFEFMVIYYAILNHLGNGNCKRLIASLNDMVDDLLKDNHFEISEETGCATI